MSTSSTQRPNFTGIQSRLDTLKFQSYMNDHEQLEILQAMLEQTLNYFKGIPNTLTAQQLISSF